MKELIKNDDAISVVVGSILVLAVLVTFMSVITSSWVPIYEGNAEADHSDELFDTFVDLSKQIENADEYPKSTTIKLGTDEIPFISNTNSVGHMEVNESEGILTLTTQIDRSLPGFGEGDSFSVKDLNISQATPIRDFRINFTLDTTYTYTKGSWDPIHSLPDGFCLELQSDTLDKLKITIEEVGEITGDGRYRNQGTYLRIRIEYIDDSGNVERWGNIWKISNIESGFVNGFSLTYDVSNTYLNLDLLAPTTFVLEYADSSPVTINNFDYFVTNTIPLYNLTQFYMKQPDAGNYNLYYTTYDKIVDSNLTLRYNTTTGAVGGTTPDINELPIGGGTLALSSDYNFFVDQSYIYDSGAIILSQNDGAVFKAGSRPVFVTSDSKNNLILKLRTTAMRGDYQTTGNGIETIQTQLEGSYNLNGFTDDVTITKDTIPELKDLWDSYFEDINSTINMNTTASSIYYPNNMTLSIWSNTPNILLSVEQKDITFF